MRTTNTGTHAAEDFAMRLERALREIADGEQALDDLLSRSGLDREHLTRAALGRHLSPAGRALLERAVAQAGVEDTAVQVAGPARVAPPVPRRAIAL